MDYHILNITEKQTSIRVVFHIPVPDATNEAGYSYRLAVKEWLEIRAKGVGITSIVPNILAEDLTKLQNGELFEVVDSVSGFSANLTPAQKLSYVETEYANTKAEKLNRFQIQLKYWGKEGDVT